MNRVVTGYDQGGRPAIVRQGEPPTVIRAGCYVTTELWVTDRTPPAASDSDLAARAWELEPPLGGSCSPACRTTGRTGQATMLSWSASCSAPAGR